MHIAAYLDEIRKLAASGQATEHSYRPALERLFKAIDPELTVINEPKGMAEVGNPDFVFQRKGVYWPKSTCSRYDLSICSDGSNAVQIEARR